LPDGMESTDALVRGRISRPVWARPRSSRPISTADATVQQDFVNIKVKNSHARSRINSMLASQFQHRIDTQVIDLELWVDGQDLEWDGAAPQGPVGVHSASVKITLW
jgi:hypothetical protein